jgi:hypothetical protein
MSTAAALEQHYRYPVPSAVVPAHPGAAGPARLRLATSGGPAANPRFFVGTLVRPVVAADLLLAVGDVVRARFHVPSAMLARILLAADPVVTCADERIRVEGFSACCSAYARVDLLPEAVDGERLGRGTTNVDLGAELRAALATVQDRERLGLSVGAEAIEIETAGANVVERRIPLPSRWLRGFLEVQAIQADLRPVAALDGAGVRRFLASIPRSASSRPAWVVARGRGLALAHHDPGPGGVRVAGLTRLRLLERLARHATGLTVYTTDGEDSSVWQLDVPGARFTLAISPEVWRGFSGEGRSLTRLAERSAPATITRVRAALGWAPRLDPADLASTTGRPEPEVQAALASLALSGAVGYDLADGGFFHRELPFDLDLVERMQPRLRDARKLVAAGAVRVESATPDGIVAWVAGGGGVEYRVRIGPDGSACTCPWTGRHGESRGPCKHRLAVRLVVDGEGSDELPAGSASAT